jgi:thiol-disulfide isomerase/thioredoxin
MINKKVLIPLLAFTLLFEACSSEESKEDSKKTNISVPTNEIVFQDTTNKPFTLIKTKEGYKLKNSNAKIIILDFFATWCPPCRSEVSVLNSLKKQYKNEIEILGITIENGIENEKLKIFKTDYKADYPLLNSSQIQKLIDDVATKLQLGNNFGIPLLVLLKDGKIIHYFQGATEEEFIDSELKKVLGK